MPELTDQTVDDEIAADWKEISAKHLTEEPATEPEAAPVQDAAPVKETPDKPERSAEERARDEAGRFTAKDDKAPVAKTAAKPEAKVEAKAPATDTQEAPAAQQRDITRPPSTWKPAAREAFAALPESVRTEIHRRETDFLNGQSQLLPDARLGSEMRQTIEPYRMLIEAEGGTPARAIGDLLRTAAVLRMGSGEQKLAAVQGIARQFGVDLTRLAPPQIGAQPGEQPQARPAEMRDPRVDALLANQQQQEQYREQQDRQQRESAAAAWMNETDAQGNPVRPYVNDVMAELTALVPQIRQHNPGLSHAQALQKAYESATWAHPEIRVLLQQKQQADSEARRRTENQERVTEARRAASTNVPRRGSLPSPGKPGRMEDTIEETARALGLLNR